MELLLIALLIGFCCVVAFFRPVFGLYAVTALYAFKGITFERLASLNELGVWVADAILITLVLRIVLFRSDMRGVKSNASVVYLILAAYLVVIVLSAINSNNSFLSHVLGSRYYLRFPVALLIGSQFGLSWAQVKTYIWTLTIVGIAQIPFAVAQFLAYGAGDFVVGTLGAGGSGALSLFLLTLVTLHLARFLSTRNANSLIAAVLLLIPTLINETKIAFILLPLIAGYFVFLRASLEIKFLRRAAIAIIMGALILAGTFYFQNLLGYSPYSVLQGEAFESYFYGDFGVEIGRIKKIEISQALISRDSHSLILGFGPGTTSESKFLGYTSDLAQGFPPLVFGTQTQIHRALLDLGYAGVIVIFGSLMLLVRTGHKIWSTERATNWLVSSLPLLSVVNVVIAAYSALFTLNLVFFVYAAVFGSQLRWARIKPATRPALPIPPERMSKSIPQANG